MYYIITTSQYTLGVQIPSYNLSLTLTVLSSDAVQIDWPSAEKSTQRTVAVWALNTVDSPLLGRKTHQNFITTYFCYYREKIIYVHVSYSY